MMIVYQLVASGIVKGFYDKRRIYSRKIFTSKSTAMEWEPEFRKLVTEETEIICLEKDVVITAHELELDASLIKIDFSGGEKHGD